MISLTLSNQTIGYVLNKSLTCSKLQCRFKINLIKMKSSIRFILSILCFLAFSAIAKPQNATLTLPQLTSCPGNNITVSLMAENLLNVGAITLNIGYDTAVLNFLGSGNYNPQFPGIITNAVTTPYTQVGIAWSNLTPGSITNGILLDMYFSFKSDSCNLTFNPDCDISDIDFIPIPFDSVSGKVKQAPPYITQNPQNINVVSGTDAHFEVSASGSDEYHWQEWNGSGWSYILNNSTYQNVNTAQLTIVATPLALNGNWYRCFLSANGGCQVYSDSAQLLVSPLPIALIAMPDTISCAFNEISVPITSLFIDSCVGFRIDIAFDPAIVSFNEIINVNPLLDGISATVSLLPEPHVSLTWTSTQSINLPDGDFANLVFAFSTGQTDLAVLNTSYILKSDMSLYNLLPQNGSISQNPDPTIVLPPTDTTVALGATAHFHVQATAAIAYQWHESQDNGVNWQLLTDNGTYSGSQSQNLVIDPVSFALNGSKYKCEVSGVLCDTTTQAATLLVDTLITSSHEGIGVNHSKTLSIISQHLGNNELSVEFIAIETGFLNIAIFDIQGRLMSRSQSLVNRIGKQTFSQKIRNLKSGTYLLHYSFVSVSGGAQVCNKAVFDL